MVKPPMLQAKTCQYILYVSHYIPNKWSNVFEICQVNTVSKWTYTRNIEAADVTLTAQTTKQISFQTYESPCTYYSVI